ncbi:O-antigen ligase family protein [Paenibacillus agri]|uniref:O-antigen ligase family protein n=1 Tax=Paenibacillus agri TaxID=2744309 RepID=A0A850EJP6_9BACL|nr:O-antigen ligase family protein [Paenibacillus agri]NUU61168.1 O-antigen ligase family protein [Paenibacillus agri]
MINNQHKILMQTMFSYLCVAMVVSAGIAACLLRGFFFTREIYFFLTIWFVLCGLLLSLKLVLLGSVGSRANNEAAMIYIVLPAPVVILCLYGIHWLRGPLSAQANFDEMLRWALYASFALIAYSSAGSKGAARLLRASWHGLGVTLCLSALLPLCTGLTLPFNVAYTSAPDVSVTGARLAGLLQYPNTFGAVMAVFLLERLFAVASGYGIAGSGAALQRGSRLFSHEVKLLRQQRLFTYAARLLRKLPLFPHAAKLQCQQRLFSYTAKLQRQLPLFPYATALLLSESRGAWLAAACACAAVLALKRRLIAPLLLTGAAPVACAALFYRQLAAAGLAVKPLPGLLLLAGCWAGAVLAGLWLERRWHSTAGRSRAALLALAAAGWTAGGTAVLMYMSARITGPSSTVAARGLLYRDALRLAGEALWLGRGGGTWRNMYLAIQSRPYVGSQTHNGYLDLLLNLGGVGLAVVLVLLLATACSLRATPHLLAPFLVLVLHSAVDFDWSYGLVWLLLFWLPALAVSPREGMAVSLRPMPYSLLRKHSRWIAGGLVCSLLLMLGLSSFRADRGALLYRAALYAPRPAEKVRLLEQSMNWNPRSTETRLELSRLVPDRQREALLRTGLQESPDHAGLNWEMAELYMEKNEPEAAVYWIRKALQSDTYNYFKWTKAIEGIWELGHNKFQTGDKEDAVRIAVTGMELLQQYRFLELHSGGKGNDRHFRMTARAEVAGQKLQWLATKSQQVARKNPPNP